MLILQGIAASPGVSYGEALVIGNEDFRIPRHFVVREAVEQELHRLSEALSAVAEDIERDRLAIVDKLGEEYGAILLAHGSMLGDPRLRSELESLIRDRHYAAEYAISRTLRRYAKAFQQLESQYLAERSLDLFDLEKALLRMLSGRHHEGLTRLTSPVVLLAHNLTPGETARLDRRFVRGLVIEVGGASSHTSIVAKGQEIPAVVGVGGCLADVSGGDLVIVDGQLGRAIVRPDAETLARYQGLVEQQRKSIARLEQLRDLPAQTADGVRINLAANIEFPKEVEACLARGADGVGLYRTEFLYLGLNREPTEEEHARAYSDVVRAMGNRPVVIRTLDLGADKMGLLPTHEEEDNPFLGLRSIRWSLRNEASFRIQLRAVLRASAFGRLELMFPMVSTLGELRRAKAVLSEVAAELDNEGIRYDRELPVGMMVETPAAVTLLDKFAREADFISIGTNDLTQYTLAVDRGNRQVAGLYRPTDPAVLRQIAHCVRVAGEAGIPVSVCGEMSGSTPYVPLLVGLGVRSLSAVPAALPEIKRALREKTLGDCESIARRALDLDDAEEVDSFLREVTAPIGSEPARDASVPPSEILIGEADAPANDAPRGKE